MKFKNILIVIYNTFRVFVLVTRDLCTAVRAANLGSNS